MTRLILVGGGHAHLFVMEHLAAIKPVGLEVILITPSYQQYYSGMLPGLMAGLYNIAECRVDLRPLVKLASVKFVEQYVIEIKANQNRVYMNNGQYLDYDLLSLDVGSETSSSWVGDYKNHLLPIKPLADFHCLWQELVSCRQKEKMNICIVGGGAAGVEIALAAQTVFPASNVTLIAGGGLLSHFNSGTRRRALQALENVGTKVVEQYATGVATGLMLKSGQVISADIVIATSGACAPRWLKTSELLLDNNGFIQVNEYHCSLSHSNVFAAGDVCFRTDVKMNKSGVHAVHAGPVLAHNLIASFYNKKLKIYMPHKSSLYLLACGKRYAIAAWGSFSIEGTWVWYFKNWIDKRFIKRFTL